jgi:hypothetical protein
MMSIEELDTRSTDAQHWAEQFCKTVEEQGKSLGDVDADWLLAWFANYWAAVHDPLAKRITELEAQLSGLTGEPTDEMIEAGYEALPDCHCTDGQPWRATLVFKAMRDKALNQ